MEWKTWFKHGDGTPRVLYLTIADKTELILSDTPDESCELSVRLERGGIRQRADIPYKNPGRIADPAVQAWAVRTAAAYLRELAALAEETAKAIEPA